jgi:hypothetical protein
MIKYALRCSKGHEFEAWFSSSAAYDAQAAGRHIGCPNCGTDDVSKALMAPNVVSGRRRETAAPAPQPKPPSEAQMVSMIRKLREHVAEHSEYVGPRFAEEARKIHHEEAEPRGIHGEASAQEVKVLKEEGVEFYPLPALPEEHN